MKNSLQKCLVFFILAAFSIFTTGCVQAVQETQDIFSGHEEIKFDLPDWQILKTQLPLLPDLAGWQIEIHSAGKSKKIFIQAEESAIKIEFEKNKTACLLAYPITIHEESDSQEAKQTFQASFFHPAGAIYPQNKANLTWQQGFAASVLKSLLAHSSDTDSHSAFQLESAAEKTCRKRKPLCRKNFKRMECKSRCSILYYILQSMDARHRLNCFCNRHKKLYSFQTEFSIL